MPDEKRFEIIYKQKAWEMDACIVVDKATGVQYLMMKNGSSIAALTPLLGPDGKPIVTPVP